MSRDDGLFAYLLRLGDSPLVLAQRLGEWVGKGPIIEEDMALTNVGLDLLGQARLWLSYAGEVEAQTTGKGRTEDELAFLRDAGAFRNVLLVEQPNGSFAETIVRQFFFDTWHLPLLRALAHSGDPRIAEIAAKSAKEAAYHVERSGDWMIRLGDGTDESRTRMQAAVDALWMYTGELFHADALEQQLAAEGVAGLVADVDRRHLGLGALGQRLGTLDRAADAAQRVEVGVDRGHAQFHRIDVLVGQLHAG